MARGRALSTTPHRALGFSPRMVAVAFGVLTIALATTLALMFAGARATEQMGRNATALHWTNSMLGSAAVARAASAQAVFFAVDREIGVVSADAAATAAGEARHTLEALRSVMESHPSGDAAPPELEVFTRAAEAVASAVEAGDAAQAAELNRTQVEPAFASAEATLHATQSQIEQRVSATESTAGRISLLTQMAVTLLIPLTALFVYRSIVRRQVRERRVALEAKLAAEQELSRAKDEFIAGLSHEFRTPLTSIYGFSELLIDSGAIDPATSLELISLINVESAELSRMVEDLLTAARLESDSLTFQRTVLDLREELEVVLAPFRRADHPIEVELAPARVLADPLRLRQVLRNLVSNAVKHGGSTVAVFGRLDRGRYLCSVVDNGEGVPPEIEGRMFERFVHDGRHALLAGSIGLGLGIAKSLVEGMGGTLEYARRDDCTLFTISLPLAPARESIVVDLVHEPAR